MKTAQMILKSSAIFTATEAAPFAGGVAVADGKIVYVGDEEGLKKWQSPNTQIYDYGNKLIMPGFVDCHAHLFLGAMFDSKHYLDLADTKNEAECAQLLKNLMDTSPGIDHITGWGWFMMNWKDNTPPSKASLDAIAKDIPVYMFCADGHTCWLNSKALAACGITKESTVKFGSIGKDEDGELNGLLCEIDALSAVMDNAFAVAADDWESVSEKMLSTMAKCGITSIADLSTCPVLEKEPAGYEKFLALKKGGKLPVRVHLYPSLGDHPDFTIAKEIKEKYCFDDLTFSGLKQFVDGTTSLYSGCMLKPYTDKPSESGFSNYPASFYAKMVTAANKEGYSVRMHVIGDKAVRIALDACEESAKCNDMSAIRNCLEHCESIDPSDLPRFAQTGAIASFQPTHLLLDANEKVERIGTERCRYEWPHKSLLDAGALLAFSTDYPVYELNPLIGIYGAVTRCDLNGVPTGVNPEEKITLSEALCAYTMGSAYSLGRERELGSLEAGKFADITVLSGNPFDEGYDALLKMESILTVMNGEVVFTK